MRDRIQGRTALSVQARRQAAQVVVIESISVPLEAMVAAPDESSEMKTEWVAAATALRSSRDKSDAAEPVKRIRW